jgi:arylsulfatase A-like enzyme
MVTSVDELVGAVVDDIKARGQLSNTVFVFTSDANGRP